VGGQSSGGTTDAQKMLMRLEGAHAFYVSTFGGMSEKTPEADTQLHRFNVAKVP
jgi:hypothetical protein